MPLGTLTAFANPLGAQVVGGSAGVQGQGTANVTVTQTTDKAIINWNTFNIGANESTRFVQPSSSSIALNRVTGGLGPSQIFGSLSANGRIFVVNPDGVLVGPGAKVDTAGFLATTHDIANADFMAGRYNFSIPGNPNASVVNQGTITAASGGFAALVAPGVRNTGTITARLGTVALASGNGFALDFYGDRLITLGVSDSIAATVKDVSTGQLLGSLISNEGKLKANGGTVELTAVAARQIVDSVINNKGVIEANSIGAWNGMIVLGAATAKSKPVDAPTQTVSLFGTLSASGKRKGKSGGTIQVTGENIELVGATIDASGRAGGGAVLIGGDIGGGNLKPAVASIAQAHLQAYAVPTASNVMVDAATKINVSAKDTGNGGKVVVWADQTSAFEGTILARGGTRSGDGGFVETSGHQQLAFKGTVDLSAPDGKSGTLLLDPQDVTIGVDVTVAALQAALASGDVIVTTGSGGGNGDITVAQNVSWTNASALTLSAYRNIFVNANITNTGGAAVALRADDAGTGVGTVSFGGGMQVSTAGSISIFYNPSVNPANSIVNTASYVNPTENYSGSIAGGGALAAYMLVNTVYDLQNIQNNLSATYALGRNVDASATANWNASAGFIPIGNDPSGLNPFAGVLNGQGHSIDRLTINSPSNPVGNFALFDRVGASGVIKNIGLTNVAVTANSGATGGLVGLNYGSIDNSYVTGSIAVNSGTVGGLVGQNNGGNITRSYATAAVSGGPNSLVGGLVGINTLGTFFGGVISNSYATGSVSAGNNSIAGGLVGANTAGLITTPLITQSYATGAVAVSNASISSEAGGLIGINHGTISHSYATGSVNGGVRSEVGAFAGVNTSAITASYAVGFVSGATVGGLVATNSGTVSNSYWDTQTTGQSSSAGGVGLTTPLLTAGLQNGFDPTIWANNSSVNTGYPYLRWQNGQFSVSVAADNLSKSYGAADTAFTYRITSGALIGSDVFSGALVRTTGENVGVYSIGLGSLALPPTYTLTYIAGNLTITPASLTITADNKTRQAGVANPIFTASYSGFVSGENTNVVSGLMISTSANINSPAGTYGIVPSGASASNYQISYINGALSVTPAPTVPSLQAGFTDIFGNGQTKGFNFGTNWRIAESTPAIALNLGVSIFQQFREAIQSANETGIAYVKSDTAFLEAKDDVKKAVLNVLSGGLLKELFETIDAVKFVQAIWNHDNATAAMMIFDTALQQVLQKYMVPTEWEINKLIGVVMKDYEAGFIDSITHSITGKGCVSLGC